MLSSQEPVAASSIRRIGAVAKMPGAAVLKALSPADARLLRRRLAEPAECVYDASFQSPDAEVQYRPGRWGQTPDVEDRATQNANDDSGIDLLACGPNNAAPPTADEERRLFLQLNYCRYRVMRIIREFRGQPLTLEAAREYVRWERSVVETRGELVRVNVPLVLAMAKRTRITGVDHSDLISEGNLALMRAVDKFDCARGFKFSTYACRAILKSFSRVAARTARYRGYFPTEFDPTLERSDFVEQRRIGLETECVDELKSIIGNNLARLSDVEATVIRARFALDEPISESDDLRAKTLEQVGEMIGVTKERVRQIQNKALNKLRSFLEDGILAT